jgi:NAD(P)-dependent dehydrogenase (short-subunit alcohol dehydrogenase family)
VGQVSALAGHSAIVTGAAGGLGLATAHALGGEGARLVIVDVDAGRLELARAQLTDAGLECVAVAGDVGDPATTRRAAAEAIERFGRIDVLANVAGISPPVPVPEITVEEFDRFMHTNCLSQLLGIQAVASQMTEQGGGSIINVASVGALVALPQLTAYCASKAAILGLTRSIAYEYAEQGIRCNAICPGGIDTPMAAEVVGSFPDREQALAKLTGRQLSKRFASPDEVAGLIVYLAGPSSAFVNGAILSIDAGHTAW